MLPMLLVIQGVVFAYASVELVGITAGETSEPKKIMPKAINSIMWRVALFYVGSVVLLTMLLPWDAYSTDESPFVTVLSNIGVPAAGGVMNLVVLTAAMSSLNSGLYSTGRILRSMALSGSAPRFTGVMSRSHVPYGGILLTSAVCVLGVGLNYVVPSDAFEIVLNFAAIGILATWALIMISHLLFWRKARTGEVVRPGYRLPGSPWTELVTLAFLVSVLGLMWADGGAGRITVMSLPGIAVALVGGWFVVRGRVRSSGPRLRPNGPLPSGPGRRHECDPYRGQEHGRGGGAPGGATCDRAPRDGTALGRAARPPLARPCPARPAGARGHHRRRPPRLGRSTGRGRQRAVPGRMISRPPATRARRSSPSRRSPCGAPGWSWTASCWPSPRPATRARPGICPGPGTFCASPG